MMRPEARPHEHHGTPLRCPVCSGANFHRRDYMLRTVEDEMFKKPWAGDQASAFVCARCGNILWFAGEERKI